MLPPISVRDTLTEQKYRHTCRQGRVWQHVAEETECGRKRQSKAENTGYRNETQDGAEERVCTRQQHKQREWDK